MAKLDKNTLKYSLACPVLMGMLLMVGTPRNVYALPQNGQVVAGQVTITTAAKQVDVTQTTSRGIINWSTFDTTAGEAVVFKQPTSTSVTLNRVTGGQGASQLFGSLSANGTVMVVNPQGVVFGAGSQVNVGGLVATTSDIDNSKFMSGDYVFDKTGNADATVSNAGEIIIAEGGLAALVGPNVTNTGLIQAKLGKVQMASGDIFTVDLYGDGLLNLQASDQLTKQLVSNSGKIAADGGEILLTAAAAQNTVNSLINMDGVLQADSVGTKDGHIVLYAEGSTAVAGNLAANQGIKTGASTVLVSGEINARGLNGGEKGGTIEVLGDQVGILSGATLNASGMNGGGTVRIGGDYHGEGTTSTAAVTIVQSDANILANALDSGDGGNVIVWANDTTVFAGNIEAKGGVNGGNGGFVETSGKSTLVASGLVDASAVNGYAGTWLLDPYSITISNGSANYLISGNPNFVSYQSSLIFHSLDNSTVLASSIVSNLNNGTNVTITTGGASSVFNPSDITVAVNILKTAGNDATLTLNAYNNVVINGGVTISSTKNKLNVVLNADKDSNGLGTVTMESSSSILTNGGSVTMTGSGIDLKASSKIVTRGGAVSLGSNYNVTLSNLASIDTTETTGTNKTGTISLIAGTGIDLGTNASLASDGAAVTLLGASSVAMENGASITSNGGAVSLTSNKSVSLYKKASIDTTGSLTGKISLTAGTDIDLGTNASLTSGGAAVALASKGLIKMAAGSSISSNGGNITLGGNGSTYAQGVYLMGDGTDAGASRLNAGGGNILVYGAGAYDLSSLSQYGVKLVNSKILTSGAGTITIDGVGAVASSLGVSSYGIYMSGASVSSTGTGLVSLTGVGGSLYSFVAGKNYGIYLANSSVSSAGDVTLNGTGGKNFSVAGVNNYGVYLDKATVSSGMAGVLTINGTGGDNTDFAGDKNYGIYLTNGSSINVEDGTIILTGLGGKNASGTSGSYEGIESVGSNTIGSAGVLANISFIADSLDVSGHMYVATEGAVTFKPYSTNRAISVAGAGSSNALQITDAILNDVTAATVVIGSSADTGALNVGEHAWKSDVRFLNGTGVIEFDGLTSSAVNTVFAETQGIVTMAAGGQITSGASGDAVTLVGSVFQNLRGADAISVTADDNDGRWLIYSQSYLNDTFGNLDSNNGAVWGTTYVDGLTVSQSGNRYVFADTPSVTITTTDLSKTYGDAVDISGAYSVTGLLSVAGAFADTIGNSLSETPKMVSIGAVDSADAGKYDISTDQTSLRATSGYTISYADNGKLTVNKRDLTVGVAEVYSRTYGDANPTLNYVVTDGSVANRDSLSGSLATAADVSSDVGYYAITQGSVNVTNLSNYNFTFNNGGLNITPALLTVTADNKSMTYLGTYPALTYQASGFKNGQDTSIFTGGLASAAVDAVVGTYDITLGTLSAGGNYDVVTNYVKGTLEVLFPTSEGNSLLKQGGALVKGIGSQKVLLALSQAASLNALAPGAGGSMSDAGALSAAEMAALAPAAGGASGMPGGIVALIECNSEMPCQLNQ